VFSRNAKITCAVTAAAVAGVAGAYTCLRAAGGDVVQEAPARFRQAPVAPPQAAAKGAAPVIPSYLEPLAEPAGMVRAPVRAASAPLPEPAPLREEPKPNVPSAEEATNTCAIGTRPMGECDCFNDAAGTLTMRPHPTQSCLEQESRRLGHHLIVAKENGVYEIAQTSYQPETVQVPAYFQHTQQAANNGFRRLPSFAFNPAPVTFARAPASVAKPVKGCIGSHVTPVSSLSASTFAHMHSALHTISSGASTSHTYVAPTLTTISVGAPAPTGGYNYGPPPAPVQVGGAPTTIFVGAPQGPSCKCN
jgi:hypothetical protein